MEKRDLKLLEPQNKSFSSCQYKETKTQPNWRYYYCEVKLEKWNQNDGTQNNPSAVANIWRPKCNQIVDITSVKSSKRKSDGSIQEFQMLATFPNLISRKLVGVI